MNAYQVTGLTHLVTATSSSSSINVTPTEAGTSFSGAGGPYFLKITNGSSTVNLVIIYIITSQTIQINCI